MKSTYSDDYRRVLEALLAARKERRVSQVMIAEALGKPQSYVSKTESGERRLDIVEFIAICRAVGVSPVKVLRNASILTDADGDSG
ncbi:MAG TPA: XRE family transcriptional regulator [Planctomycetaceae bacterium]|nr:XRE family transcriptional regulator [Planctomycetaceae bacterium]